MSEELRQAPQVPAPKRRSRWRRVLLVGAVVLGLIVALLAGASLYLYKHFDGNISRSDVFSRLSGKGDRPTKGTDDKSMTILVIGSDSRAGANNIGDGDYEGTQRSDTTIMVRIAADRSRAWMVSIPRDTYMEMPDCELLPGHTKMPTKARFNAAFMLGGPACSIAAAEQLTGERVDHYVEVDFTGFKAMVDRLGGVEICLKEPISDKAANLELPAGPQRINGEQALGFVRVRKSIGDGSDIGRIERQQYFIGRLAQEALSSPLTQPDNIYGFVDELTKSITVDEGFAVTEMISLATSFRSVESSNISFATLPFVWADGTNGPRGAVVPDEDAIAELFANIDAIADPGRPAPSLAPRAIVAPETIRVKVVNTTTTAGLAADVVEKLTAQGFNAVADRTTTTPSAVTVVRHSPTRAESGKTVSLALPGSVTVEDPSVGSTVVVELGTDYSEVIKLRSPATPTPTPRPTTASPSPSSTGTGTGPSGSFISPGTSPSPAPSTSPAQNAAACI